MRHAPESVRIAAPRQEDTAAVHSVFETTVTDVFLREGIGHLQEELRSDIEAKKRLFREFLDGSETEIRFLVAKQGDRILGTVSYGPPNEIIVDEFPEWKYGMGELGSLFVLPAYQGRGLGSLLIEAMRKTLKQRGIQEFCLDSGYASAQKKWMRKFGKPIRILSDRWGPGLHHCIWLCPTEIRKKGIDHAIEL